MGGKPRITTRSPHPPLRVKSRRQLPELDLKIFSKYHSGLSGSIRSAQDSGINFGELTTDLKKFIGNLLNFQLFFMPEQLLKL